MIKHTTLNIDTNLVIEAAAVLGTTGTTETIHRALAEVIDQAHLRWLAAYEFPGLTPCVVEEMRQVRSFENG